MSVSESILSFCHLQILLAVLLIPTGTLCEYDLTECDAFLPCQNNGTCSFNPKLIEPGKNGTGFYCSCPNGFSGLQCEEDVSVCNSTQNICLNGGVCQDGIGNKFYCECMPGWTGVNCQLDVDDCVYHQCQNGGVCVDKVNDYSCACPFGYTGQLCETKLQVCEENPCKNGAFCLQEDEIPVCYCVPDFHGKLCEERYDECLPTKDDIGPKCKNGGTCIDGVGEFTCSCPPEFFGRYCQCTEYNRTDPKCQDTSNGTTSTSIVITNMPSPTWSISSPMPLPTAIDQTGMLSPTPSDSPEMTSTVMPESSDFLVSSDDLTTTVERTEEFSTSTMQVTLPPFSDLSPTPSTPWVTGTTEETDTVSPTPTSSFPSEWSTSILYPDNSSVSDFSPTVTDEMSTIFASPSPTPSESTITLEPTSTTFLMSESTATAAMPEESTIVLSSEPGSYSVDITPTLDIETSTIQLTPSMTPSESIYPSETVTGPLETVTVTPPTMDNETTTEGLGTVNFTTTEKPVENRTFPGDTGAGPWNLTTTDQSITTVSGPTESGEPVTGTSSGTEAPTTQNTTITEEWVTITSTESSVTMTITVSEEFGNATVGVTGTPTEPTSVANVTASMEPEPGGNSTASTEPGITAVPPPTATNFTAEVTTGSSTDSTTITVSEEFGNVTVPVTGTPTQPTSVANVTASMEPEPGGNITTSTEPGITAITPPTGTNFTAEVTTVSSMDTTKPVSPISSESTTVPSTSTSINEETTPPTIITPTSEAISTSTPELNITDPCSNYCQNNAKCISTSIEPICLCPFKFAGKQCEIAKQNVSIPSFKGTSFLKYKLPSESVRVVDVSLQVATLVPEGVVLYTVSEGNDDIVRNLSYALIFIQNGHLTLHFSCGSQSMEFVETRTRVNNGYNFTLDFRMEMLIDGLTNDLNCLGKLAVNQSFVMSGEQLVAKGNLALFEHVYIGGVDRRVARSSGSGSDMAAFLPGLRGCAYKLLINKEEREMYEQAMDGKEIGECESFACVINPCFGHAECIPTSKLPFWECLCPIGFEGPRCQIELCKSDPCLNGGTCTPSPLLRSFPNHTLEVSCLCPFGFSGLTCQNRINISRPSFHPTLDYSSFMSYYGIPRFEDWFQMKFHFVTTNFSQISLLMFIGNTRDPSLAPLRSRNLLGEEDSDEQVESPLPEEEFHVEDSYDKVPDFFSISFLQGFIAVTWNLGSGTQRVITPSRVDSRLNVHTLFAGRSGRQAWVKVDGMRNITGKTGGPLWRLNVDTDLYIGGYESFRMEGLPHDLPLHAGFQGCIFDLGFRVKNMLYLPKAFRGRNVKNCFEDC